MLSSNVLFLALVAALGLSSASAADKTKTRGLRSSSSSSSMERFLKSSKKDKDKKKKKTKVKYRTFGTASPDASGACYPGKYYDKKGKTELGDYFDCVTSAPQFPGDGLIVFNVTTTFTPYDPDEITLTTTCEVTVTPKEGLPDTFNAIEECKNKKKGIVSPEGLVGTVKLKGKVDNTQSPTLTFDLLWTIDYKEKKAKKTKKPKEPSEDDDTAPAPTPAAEDDDTAPAPAEDDDTAPAPAEDDDTTPAPTGGPGSNRPPSASGDDD